MLLYISMNNLEKRRLNHALSLKYIHQFGWLRTVELGKLMWPHLATSRQSADRLARNLIESRLVIVRELPERSGRALVLSASGARLLSEEGIIAESGKDIGKQIEQGWVPNLTWRHDLIAQGVLCELHKDGYEIYPEHEIRKWNLDLGKIPDGLAVRDDETFWIEVENARKSGKEMKRLARALCTVATGGVKVGNFIADTALVAYVPGVLSEAGHAINHRLRVRNAIATYAREDIDITWAECELLGNVGVKCVELYDETIENEGWRAIFEVMTARGWVCNEDKTSYKASYGDFLAIITKDFDQFYYTLMHPNLPDSGDYGSSLSEAKTSIAKLIFKLNTTVLK